MNELLNMMDHGEMDALWVTETKRKGYDTTDLRDRRVAIWVGVPEKEKVYLDIA